MRRPACEHDRVYSGQSNMSGKFAYICRRCGQSGWHDEYVLSQVNANEFYLLRVEHGWATPLPPPPRLPGNTELPPQRSGFVAPALLFAALFALCVAGSIPWGTLGPVMPLWASLLGAGVALGMFAICYVGWKKACLSG